MLFTNVSVFLEKLSTNIEQWNAPDKHARTATGYIMSWWFCETGMVILNFNWFYPSLSACYQDLKSSEVENNYKANHKTDDQWMMNDNGHMQL